MDVLRIKWKTGDGYIYLSTDSREGDATVSISSDANTGRSRTQDIEFTAFGQNGKVSKKTIKIFQYGSYDGKYATTPESEYDFVLDCETANASFSPETDVLVDGGNA